ncbi:lamin tail domain-containing protein [Patescibacteria group bacterium]|nr:lamin tail domain-containing protein [Patescibacteria group bacterium]MBU1663664.1 lamin tail domain-containing protein [Patescibacteria group bacterium]MBU1934143.1 lamin tail domain-containing protein [Patescibacteria group bacterium]MBU2007574.1 lamin tail domain-containing protein [Patescibacteria group bacterium]MBU2233549.1 lamin tail domain-containing protein [Patescibacteria group bacterium]
MRRQARFFYWVKIIIILTAVSVGFFCFKNVCLAIDYVVISEVQITGGVGKTENDFIEIYNFNNFQVNLKGYRLVKRTKTGITDTSIKSWTTDVFIPANGYYLWANSNYTNISTTPDATTTAAISNDNGIAIRFGAEDTGAIIDSVAWGGAQNIFIEGLIFPTNPGDNQSLARKLNLDTNNNSVDFFVQEKPNPQNSSIVIVPSPTAECGNGNVEDGEQCDDGNLINSDGCNSICQTENDEQSNEKNISTSTANVVIQQIYNFGDVLINEFVSDPADNEVEWVEIYNKIDKEIDLTGWWIEEGSKAKTKLTGIISSSGSGRYKVFEKPAGSLNNDGDIIILYDSSGKIIDQAVYGNWDDGDKNNNAPVASDPFSMARKFDGYNTFNNANDFSVTIKPTKGASNIIQVEDEVSLEAKAKFDFSNDIFISEILPNPIGDDTKLEFIEIYNAGQREVDLTGWSLSNEDDKKKNLENIATSTIIKAGKYLAFFRPRAKIVLHNDQGQVKLFQPLADKPLMLVDYKNVKEGWSYNLIEKSSPPCFVKVDEECWEWSETLTPGAMNVFKIVNHAPEVEFSFKSPALVNIPVIFDNSDTVDQDDDKLKFSWDFGDGFKNNLANPEHTYLKTGIYKVKLAVSDGKEKAEKIKSVKVVGRVDELNINVQLPYPSLARGIIINEIFPNPDGADVGQEWLELKNTSLNNANLLNWRVENGNGKYKFKSQQMLKAGAFYVLNNAQSKLALKNTDDVINLYNDLDELVDTVEYANTAEGESYAIGANSNWFWTTKVTPAKENIISLADSKSIIAAWTSKAVLGADGYIETTLEKIKELEIGSLVKIKGTVAVEPGILGVQIFYIVGSPGMQIYNYKKDFPMLKVGDYIEVTGELTQSQDEFRIKTKDKNDINVIERKQAPVALALSCDAINEENVGQLITIMGEITDKKNSTLYVDDGSDEIQIYIKKNTGIDTKILASGQQVSITGILSKTKTGLRLMPRYQTDIVKINSTNELSPQVFGEVVKSKEWDVAQRDKKLELLKYLLIIAGGVIIILAGLFVKARRKI